MLPGWYGTGQALHEFADQGLLKAMASEWPYFQTILANMEMVLAKSDMSIAAHYAELVTDQALSARLFGRIKSGWQQSCESVLFATGQTHLLQAGKGLSDSIKLRLPYIEPGYGDSALNYYALQLR